MLVNRKRVARLMQQDNLLPLAPRSYVMPTTDSRHDFEVHLNLAAPIEVTAVNQLWNDSRTAVEFLSVRRRLIPPMSLCKTCPTIRPESSINMMRQDGSYFLEPRFSVRHPGKIAER
jgi:transposase InsO family protein